MNTEPLVFENAVVVHHDRAERRSLPFAHGHVVREASKDALRIDLEGHYVYPGLINAHDHLQLNCFPRLAHDEPYADAYEWISAFEHHLESDAVRELRNVAVTERLWQGALKNLLAGTTTVVHHDPFPGDERNGFPVFVPGEIGWCHSLGLASGQYGLPVAQSFHDTPGDWRWVIHLAEGTSSRARTELARLREMGCLDKRTVLVHGVGLSESDVGTVIREQAAVVWCPASNLELLGETLDPRRLFESRALTLGTDSRLTGSNDMLAELRVAAECSTLSPSELMRLVTADASRIFQLPTRGHLNEGAVADCLVLEAKGDAWETLLNATRSDVRMVVRDGEPSVADAVFEEFIESAVGIDVDGRAKALSRRMYRHVALHLEPGVESRHAPAVLA